MPERVELWDQGDGWWQGPSRVTCEVVWQNAQELDGLEGAFWLLRLSAPMFHHDRMTQFEYALALETSHDRGGDSSFEDWGVPVYPVLRRVDPGDHVSFDGELLPGVKAALRWH